MDHGICRLIATQFASNKFKLIRNHYRIVRKYMSNCIYFLFLKMMHNKIYLSEMLDLGFLHLLPWQGHLPNYLIQNIHSAEVGNIDLHRAASKKPRLTCCTNSCVLLQLFWFVLACFSIKQTNKKTKIRQFQRFIAFLLNPFNERKFKIFILIF